MQGSVFEGIDELIEWWFSGTTSLKFHRWFGKSQEIDAYVIEHYKALLHKVEDNIDTLGKNL